MDPSLLLPGWPEPVAFNQSLRYWSLTRILAAATAVLAVTALSGWLFDVPIMRSIVSDAVEMKLNAVFALLFSSLSLFILNHRPTPRATRIAVLLGIVAGAIGLLTLCEYVFRLDLHIDQLLFRDEASAFSPVPGRMSPFSAIGFIAIGAALWSLPRVRLRRLCMAATVVASSIGVLAMLGYLWGATELITDKWVPPVAMNTSIGFMLLGIGLIRTSMRIARHAQPGLQREHIELKVLVGFTIALVLFCLGGGITYRQDAAYAKSAEWVGRAQEIRATLGDLNGWIADAEATQRSFLLAGDTAATQESFARLSTELTSRLEALDALLRDDPEQMARLVTLRSLMTQRMRLLSEQISTWGALNGAAPPPPAPGRRPVAAVAGSLGAGPTPRQMAQELSAMQAVRAQIRSMDASAAELNTRRAANLSHDRTASLIALLATLAIATATLCTLFFVIVHDIRDRARITRAMRDAQSEALRASRAKSEFLAAMSHEIRTPMNGVIGMVDVLHQSSLMGPQLEMVTLIRESADSLLQIIDDILDFSKVEAGRLEIEQTPMSLGDVVEKSCTLLNRVAERKATSLKVFVDPDIPRAVMGDAARIRQVVVNLTTNAIKFSSGLKHAGHVTVRAVLIRREARRAMIELRVSDNGIGMDQATLKRLFTAFTQADASTTRRYGGTGLGLVICRQLVALMGGEISVASAVDTGSAFTARIPFDLVPDTELSAPAPQALQTLSCLVVGAGADLADDVGKYLQSAGADVSRIPTLNAAYLASCARPSVLVTVVTEENEPVAQQLRIAVNGGQQLGAGVVAVVLTRGRHRNPGAKAERLTVLDGNALTRQTLISAVAKTAGHVGDVIALPGDRQRHKVPPPPSREEAVRQRRLILVAEDNDINQKVIRQQLTVLGYTADVVNNGKEALHQWQTGDYSLLLTDLHMPDTDGYDLTLAIRMSEDAPDRLPIIALTANALQGEAERCKQAGMDDYLSKPASLASLAAVLEKWLPGVPIGAPALTAPAAIAAIGPPLDVAVLESLIGNDSEVVDLVIGDFRASARRLGEQLLAAGQAAQISDAAAVAHKLKSSARSVGALPLGELCASIEAAGQGGDPAALNRLLPAFRDELARVEAFLATRAADVAPRAISA